MVHRQQLAQPLDQLLQPARFKDYGSNGLQVEDAIAAGAQALVTGEIPEPQAHYARECGITYLACGHHATERHGAPAVAAHVAQALGLDHRFIDVDNPA